MVHVLLGSIKVGCHMPLRSQEEFGETSTFIPHLQLLTLFVLYGIRLVIIR